jgi:hypothetical protein
MILGGTNTWITAKVDEFPDLYPAYVAQLSKLEGEESKTDREYTQLSKGDFRKLSPTRQIAEFRTLGVDAHTAHEVLKIMMGQAPNSAKSGEYVLPTSSVKELPLLDILHHEHYLGKHIHSAAKRRGGAIRRASQLARTPGDPRHRTSEFQNCIDDVQTLTRSLDIDRRTHLLLTNRKKVLMRQLRHQPLLTVRLPQVQLEDLPTSNNYASLDDELGDFFPAAGLSDAREPSLTEDTQPPTQ